MELSMPQTPARAFLLVLLLAGVCCCRGEQVRLRLLHSSDIHGNIAAADAADWLRLATRIDHERAVGGADRTLLIDTGDTIQGSFEAMATRGALAVEMLQMLNYDIWVLGNHELDFGIARLRELIAPVRDKIIVANFQLTAEPMFPAWRMFRLGAAQVAVIGGITPLLPQWFWGDDYSGYRVEPLHARLRQVLPQVLAAQPDLIVLAMHQGWHEHEQHASSEVAAIARDYPEINLILGGHSHRAFAGRNISATCWYVQPAPHAQSLAVIDIVVDTAQRRIIELKSQLLPVDADIEQHAQLKARLLPQLQAIEQQQNQIIGHAVDPIPATGMPGRDCATSELICRAIAAGTGASIVMHGKLSEWHLRPGSIRESDLFRLIPYENNIGIASLTVEQLRRIIAEQWRLRHNRAYCGLWGANAVIAADGSVSELRIDPAAFDAQHRVKVAFNSYSIAGAGGRFVQLRQLLHSGTVPIEQWPDSTRQLVRQYIQKQSPLHRLHLPNWIEQR